MIDSKVSPVKACTLVSGSSGNSIYVQNRDSSILIDAGVPAKILEQRMAIQGIDPASLQGILITHEHSDHIAGVSVLARRYKIPVYMSEKTWLAAQLRFTYAERMDVRFISPKQAFLIGSLSVQAFRTPHDAADPMGYRIDTGSAVVSVATDIGRWSDQLFNEVASSDITFIEANYDNEMLWDGPYPWPLKKRIDSAMGHLSNLECADAILELLETGTKRFVLIHLSQENNRPELAYQSIEEQLAFAGANVGRDYLMLTSPRHTPGLWQYL